LSAKASPACLRAWRNYPEECRTPHGGALIFACFSDMEPIASVCAGELQHCRARAASPQVGAVVRDFKDRAFPMAEERWSVASGRHYQRGIWKNGKAKNERNTGPGRSPPPISDDRHPGSHCVWQSHGFNDQGGIIGARAK
jgi:hypothetical protein